MKFELRAMATKKETDSSYEPPADVAEAAA
jgi:hypothetical protein